MASKAPPPVSAGPSTPLLPSSARRQPMRQARTNPARKNAANPKLAGNSRLQNGTGSHSGHPTPSTQPPAKFYPALTAFTDAVDALPSETIRHFTLLREVDAKAYGPEAILRSLITAAQELPPPDDPYEFDPALEAMKQLDDLQRRREELVTPAEAMLLHELEATQSVEIASGARTILGHPETRRSRCHQIRTQITEILVTLDEKIHVITTAYEALQKHLQRIDHAYSYVQHEIPDVYRLGSTEHWAYKEPVKKGTAAAQARAAERAQREAEERHAAAQQRELETSNTRSETRREALLRQKAAAQQAAATASVNEEDEQAPREQNHAQPAKKLHGNSKLRKEQEAALASAKRMAEHQSANGVGGGLIPAAAATAAATTATAATAATTPLVPPQQKRRKTTNTTKETPTADKVSAPGTANKGAVSPRAGTPASTASKRGGKSGSGTGAGRGGRRNGPGPVTAGHTSTTSPHLGSASSPIHALFPPVKTKKEKDVVVDDPAAIAASASASAAAVSTPLPVAPRRNSKVTGTAPGADAFRDERPPTNADIVMGGTSTEAPLPPPPQQSSTTSAKAPDSQFLPPPEKPKRKKDLHHSITVASHNNPDEMQGVEPTDPHPRPQQQQPHSQSHTHGRKDSTDNKKDDKKRKRHDDHHNPASTATTDAAAASTAATSTATEKPTKSHSAKARPSTSDGLQHPSSSSTTGNSKRGNRKRADSSAAALMKVEEPEEPEEPVDEDADADAEDDADEDEPRYCICNQVSYGEMVACDGDACKKEWFHLDCVGLQTAPKGKAKWYCEDCLKESISRGRRTGSRA